jgi:hypothetical protein
MSNGSDLILPAGNLASLQLDREVQCNDVKEEVTDQQGSPTE